MARAEDGFLGEKELQNGHNARQYRRFLLLPTGSMCDLGVVLMPAYDFRCKTCGQEFTLFYKTYHAYDHAERTCSNCGSSQLSRVINRIALQTPARDFTKMSAGEMLSVLESGDSRQVGQMFQQVGGSSPELGADFHETTQQLLQGEPMEKVEKTLQEKDTAKKSAASS